MFRLLKPTNFLKNVFDLGVLLDFTSKAILIGWVTFFLSICHDDSPLIDMFLNLFQGDIFGELKL